MRDDLENLLTVKELAAALKLTEQTIQRYVLRKEIPFHKIMRAVRFRPSEINCWIDNGGLQTNEEVPTELAIGMRNEEYTKSKEQGADSKENEQLEMSNEQLTIWNEQGASSN